MITTATARRENPPTTNRKQANRFSRRWLIPQKPLYQAVSHPYTAKRRAEATAPDCIKDGLFIDPPYNTGNDFVYEDDFAEDADSFLRRNGYYDEDGNRLLPNRDANGRFHTDWLNMIYPRLRIARDLLTEDGVIFVQIDDNEVFNLKKICDEVFGTVNFLGAIIQNKQNAKNDTVNIQKNHEYLIVYRKNTLFDGSGTKILPTLVSMATKERDVFEENGRYYYLNDAITTRGEGGVLSARPNLGYTVYFNPSTNEKIAVCDYDVSKVANAHEIEDIYTTREDLLAKGFVAIRPPKVRGQLGVWTWSIDKFTEQNDELVITGRPDSYILKKRTFVPAETVVRKNGKLFYIDKYEANVRSIWDFSTNDGTIVLNDVMGNSNTFSNAKNLELLKNILGLVSEKDFIILDFFSGSATTAHAVMQLNAEDGGKRKFIMVQLPEICAEGSEAAKAGYANICEIGKERIRRAGAKIVGAAPCGCPATEQMSIDITGRTQGSAPTDIGFRVLKLSSSNMKDVYYTPEEYAQMNFNFDGFADNIKEDRSDEDLLFQVMLELGIQLSAKIVQDGDVYRVNDNYLIACFKRVDTALITEIARQKPYYAVFRDSSFASDSAMVNFEQIFATYSPKTTRRVL